MGALDRLDAALAEPRTASDCFVPPLQARDRAASIGLALVEAVAHLNHLHRQGAGAADGGDGGVGRPWLWQALVTRRGRTVLLAGWPAARASARGPAAPAVAAPHARVLPAAHRDLRDLGGVACRFTPG
jgi:hypothetical protein